MARQWKNHYIFAYPLPCDSSTMYYYWQLVSGREHVIHFRSLCVCFHESSISSQLVRFISLSLQSSLRTLLKSVVFQVVGNMRVNSNYNVFHFFMGLGSITRGTSLANVLSTGEKTTGDSQWERKTERGAGRNGGVTKQKKKRDIKEKELKEVRPITCLVLPSKMAGTGGSSRQSHSAEQHPLRRR